MTHSRQILSTWWRMAHMATLFDIGWHVILDIGVSNHSAEPFFVGAPASKYSLFFHEIKYAEVAYFSAYTVRAHSREAHRGHRRPPKLTSIYDRVV